MGLKKGLPLFNLAPIPGIEPGKEKTCRGEQYNLVIVMLVVITLILLDCDDDCDCDGGGAGESSTAWSMVIHSDVDDVCKNSGCG